MVLRRWNGLAYAATRPDATPRLIARPALRSTRSTLPRFGNSKPSAAVERITISKQGEILEIGKGPIVRQGSDVARLMGEQAFSVTLPTRDLQTAGHRTDPRSGQDHCAATAVEQGAQGEFGAMALHHLAREGSCGRWTLTLPDSFMDQVVPLATKADFGLTGTDIAATARQAAQSEGREFRWNRD